MSCTGVGGVGGSGLWGKGVFINCRGWWSREVDLKLILKGMKLDILGLAEMLLQKEEDVW